MDIRERVMQAVTTSFNSVEVRTALLSVRTLLRHQSIVAIMTADVM